MMYVTGTYSGIEICLPVPGLLVSNVTLLGNFRNLQEERISKGYTVTSKTLSRKSNTIFRRLLSRRRQMMVMQCTAANVAQIMTWGFNDNSLGKIQLKNALHPLAAVDCSLMPTQTQARCKT